MENHAKRNTSVNAMMNSTRLLVSGKGGMGNR